MDKAAFLEHAEHEKSHWWFQGRRHAVGQLVHSVLENHGRGNRVVEIGCGTGANVASLSRDYHCIGVDISHHAIAIATENYPGCEFIAINQTADIQSEIAAADAVLLLDVLEHVEDDFLFLSEILSLMSPGAILVLTVPADPALWSEHDEALFHFRRYTPQRLRAVFDGMPVSLRMMSGFNWKLAPLVRAVRSIKSKSSTTAQAAKPAKQTDLSMPPRWINGALKAIFASESKSLVRALNNRDSSTVRHPSGISLVAVLERREGRIAPRAKPSECNLDQYTPPTCDLGQIRTGATTGQFVP